MKFNRIHFFLAAVVCLCFVFTTFSDAVLTKLSISRSWLDRFRGGASKKSASSAIKSKKKKPTRQDDDDDVDDEEEERPRSRRVQSKSKNSKTANKKGSSSCKTSKGKMQLIPWGLGGGNSNKKKGGVSWQDRLDSIRKTGAAVVKEAYRKAKVMKSSAFEGILLKATWPGNEAVPPELLSEIIKYSIPAYKYARADSDDDPYYMTMHKLWTKMCEKDWRTVTKSLFILHCISRDSSVEDCGRFADAIKDMAKIRNPKKPDHKYFDVRRLVSELDDHSVPYEPFVTAYGSYVIYRSKHFSSKFEELKNVKESTSEKKVVALLKKAQALIKTALQCTVTKKERNIIIAQAVKVLAADLRELWKLYGDLLAPLAGSGNPYAEPKAISTDLSDLLSFYKDNDQQVKTFLADSAKSFQKLRVKIPTEVEPSSVSLENISSRIEEILKLSGGFTLADSEDGDEEEDSTGFADDEEEDSDEDTESSKSNTADDEEEDGDEDEDNDDEGEEEIESEEDDNGDDDDDDTKVEEVENDSDPEDDGDSGEDGDDATDDDEEENDDDAEEEDDSEESAENDDEEEED